MNDEPGNLCVLHNSKIHAKNSSRVVPSTKPFFYSVLSHLNGANVAVLFEAHLTCGSGYCTSDKSRTIHDVEEGSASWDFWALV